MDIISFQLASKALKKIGMIGTKKVDESTLANDQTMVYSAAEDKYIPKTIYTNIKDWETNIKYLKDELVYFDYEFYRVLVEHTSSTLENDLAASKIQKLVLIKNLMVNTNEFISLSRETKILANTNFELPLDMTYKVNSDQLMIQLNNYMLVKGVDWEEVDQNNIKFLYDIDKTWSIIIRKIGMNVSSTKAEDISIADLGNHFTSTNVEDALSELFQNVDSGKQILAAAIVDKGGTASAASTFQELANAIGTMSGEVISNDYLNIIANEEKIFPIQGISNENLIISTLILIPEQNSVSKVLSNLDVSETNFLEEGDIIKEEGKFKNKSIYEITKTFTQTAGNNFLNEYQINGIEFLDLL